MAGADVSLRRYRHYSRTRYDPRTCAENLDHRGVTPIEIPGISSPLRKEVIKFAEDERYKPIREKFVKKPRLERKTAMGHTPTLGYQYQLGTRIPPGRRKGHNVGVVRWSPRMRRGQATRTLSLVSVGRRGKVGVPIAFYDTALTESAYGNPQLGDLFGDLMGSVVGEENWEARPQWMKDIKLKVDPAKVIETAARVVAPKAVSKVVAQAQKVGVTVRMKDRRTGRSRTLTPATAGATWSAVSTGYPLYSAIRKTAADIPIWAYIAGGGAVLLVVVMAMRK